MTRTDGRTQLLGATAIAVGTVLAVLELGILPRGRGSLVVTTAGLFVLLVGGYSAVHHRYRSSQRWHPDDVSGGLDIRTPGDRVAALPDHEFRARLQGHVVSALVACGHSRSEAREMIQDGTWTDDQYAAAYLGTQSLRDSLALKFVSIGSSGPVTRRLRERTLTELRRLRDRTEGQP